MNRAKCCEEKLRFYRQWGSPGSWVKWLNDACLFTKNASSVMRASCSSNISESLNHPYSMIPIDALHLFLHPFPLLSRALHLFLYSFNPSTLHSISKHKNNSDLSRKNSKLSATRIIFYLLWKIYQKISRVVGRYFPRFFFTSEIFRTEVREHAIIFLWLILVILEVQNV